ncbi:MAG: heavy-metal-associated domain-containing protein, partial [Ilumatobacteraceae bacterium]
MGCYVVARSHCCVHEPPGTDSTLPTNTCSVKHPRGLGPNFRCHARRSHVTDALTGLDDVQSVTVSLEDKTATVTSTDTLSLPLARAAVEDAGYT